MRSSGSKLAAWTYDTVKKGLVTSSTSYVGSTPGSPRTAYPSAVSSYDAAGNPLQQTVSIPADAPAFAGTTYTTTSYYHPDSTLLAKTVPTIGGLPGETIRYTYDIRGALSGIRGASMVLANTIFTPIGQLSQFNRYNGTNSGYSTYGYDVATGSVLAVRDNAVLGGSGHYAAMHAAGNECFEPYCDKRPKQSYQYTMDTKLETRSSVSASEAMRIFRAKPAKVFPFRVSGCTHLSNGKECQLHTRWNVNPPGIPGVPLSPTGTVGVTTRRNSTTFTVLDYGYFDDPGSTISFSTWTNGSGETFLRQTAYSYGGEMAVAIGINYFGAHEATWKAQAANLTELINNGH